MEILREDKATYRAPLTRVACIAVVLVLVRRLTKIRSLSCSGLEVMISGGFYRRARVNALIVNRPLTLCAHVLHNAVVSELQRRRGRTFARLLTRQFCKTRC